jgi:hypothetical protein
VLGAVGNAVVLVLLPLASAGLCTYSLLRIDQLPVVPVLAGLAAALLGVRAQVAIREMLELRDAVRYSHSSAPPAPR